MEGVFGECLVARVLTEVALHVLARQLDSPLRAVHGVDEPRSSAEGEEREAARVAEHVANPLAAGVSLQQGAVLALVHEEAGLLAFLPVGREDDAVLLGLFLVGVSPDVAVDGVQARLEGQRALALVVYRRQAVAHGRLEGLLDNGPVFPHPHRVHLHDGRSVVDVDDEAW